MDWSDRAIGVRSGGNARRRSFTESTCKRSITCYCCNRSVTTPSRKRTFTTMDTNVVTTRDLAAAIRGRRLALGLTQAEVATRVGVSRPWLTHVEAGKPTANIGLVIRLLDALGLRLEVTDRPAAADDSATDLDALL